MQTLSAPRIVRCYFDTNFEPRLPAMCLRWDCDEADWNEQIWELPEGVRFNGPPPQEFGMRIRRLSENAYALHLLWDRTYLNWLGLTRLQLLNSDLDALLAALGTDLWYLLDQPVSDRESSPLRAA